MSLFCNLSRPWTFRPPFLSSRFPPRSPSVLGTCPHPNLSVNSCTSSFQRLVARAEYVIARKSDTWYFAALLIACAINLIVFFAGYVDGRSSLGCSTTTTGAAHMDCRSFPVFHWLTQSWSPDVDSRALGLRLSGRAALAVRILTIMHFTFATAMLIGWYVIDVIPSEWGGVGCRPHVWDCPS